MKALEIISKALLSEVFGREISEIEMYEEPNTLRLTGEFDGFRLGYFLDNRHWYFINIYELAHRCKEWAFEFRFDNKPTNNRYYRQRSGYEDKFNVEKQKREKLGYMTLTFGCLGHTKTFYADTEPEAIFQACQWILDNKGK